MNEAIAALEAYGYVKSGERYIRPGKLTQQWMAQRDGFLRFDDPGGVPVPYKVLDGEEHRLAGIDHTNPAHQDHFEWLWPAEEVARIYAHAAEQAAAGWPDRNESVSSER